MNSTTMEARSIALLSSLIFSLDDDLLSIWNALTESIDVVWVGPVFLIIQLLKTSSLLAVLYRLLLKGDATDKELWALEYFGSHK